MPGGSNRKQRIIEAFDALCGAIAAALGAAEGRRDAAVRAHAEAMVEMWLREDGLESARADPGLGPLLANKKLFGPVGAGRGRPARRLHRRGWSTGRTS